MGVVDLVAVGQAPSAVDPLPTVVIIAQRDKAKGAQVPRAEMHVADVTAAFGGVARDLDEQIAQQMLGWPTAIEIMADAADDRVWSVERACSQFACHILAQDRSGSWPIARVHRAGEAGEGAIDLSFIEQQRQGIAHAVMAAHAS